MPRMPTALTSPRFLAGGLDGGRCGVGSGLVGHGVLLAVSMAVLRPHASGVGDAERKRHPRASDHRARSGGELARDRRPSRSSLAAAAPASIAAAASSCASARRSRIGRCTCVGIPEEPVRDDARGGVEQHDVAHGALLAVEHAADDRGVVGGVAAQQIVDVGERDAEIARVEVVLVDVAPADLPQPAVAGRGELVEPVVAAEDERRRAARRNTPVMSGTRSSCATPTAFASARAGLHSGPRKLKTVGTPSSARVGPAWRKPGWNADAKANVMPARVERLGDRLGRRASGRCRARRARRDEPDDELAARLPCLTTGTPDAAATTAAIVETFTVPNRSPPVPTMSSTAGSTGKRQRGLEDRVAEADDLVDRLALRAQRDEEAGELRRRRRRPT